MRYLRVVLPLLCVREACAEPKTGAAALELDTRPIEGAPPLLDGTERGARGEPLLGPTQVNQYKELQTIKMKNDAMFGEVKTINKNGRIDLTWESGKDNLHTHFQFFSHVTLPIFHISTLHGNQAKYLHTQLPLFLVCHTSIFPIYHRYLF